MSNTDTNIYCSIQEYYFIWRLSYIILSRIAYRIKPGPFSGSVEKRIIGASLWGLWDRMFLSVWYIYCMQLLQKPDYVNCLPSKGICWRHSNHNSCLMTENDLISADMWAFSITVTGLQKIAWQSVKWHCMMLCLVCGVLKVQLSLQGTYFFIDHKFTSIFYPLSENVFGFNST